MNKKLDLQIEALEHSVEGQESPKTVAVLKTISAALSEKKAAVAVKKTAKK
jgi:hypothetical protein